MSKTDATEDLGGGSPCESASNKTIQIDGMALADGTEVLLDLVKANYLNSNGIITALNLTGSFVSWGNETACYPANTDVTDYFYCVSRMFSWVANSVILSMWSKVDKKLNKRLIESVTQSINIEFVDTDTEALVNKLIAGYEEITGRTLYPADPVRAFILWLASVIIQERVNINESAKQNLPRYATGQNLDSLSEIFHNTYRLQPTAARTTLGFSITTALDKEYVITDEIEVTVDGYINFVTTGYLTFPAGETYAEVEAVCTTLGEDGNGFTPGQVSRLVTEEFLYFKEVANTTETAGGSGEESDTAYYNRMRESEESYTTAGPRGSYIYHAKAVSSQISDVSAESPQDGVADIRIMLYGGELPSEELIKEVQAYLSADDIRPMTDKVTVAAPTTVDFDIELTYYIPKDKEASTKEIKRAVDLAVESYELWQTSKMGRDINPSYFYAILMDSGIKRADIKKPVFTEIPKGSVAVLKKCTVTFGGVEDE